MSTFKKAKVVMLPTNQKTKYLMVYSDVEKTKGKLILNGLKNGYAISLVVQWIFEKQNTEINLIM